MLVEILKSPLSSLNNALTPEILKSIQFPIVVCSGSKAFHSKKLKISLLGNRGMHANLSWRSLNSILEKQKSVIGGNEIEQSYPQIRIILCS